MDKGDLKLLEDDGWTVDCESPFELNDKDGSRATGRAADYVLDYLRDGQPLVWCSECGRREVSEGVSMCEKCKEEYGECGSD